MRKFEFKLTQIWIIDKVLKTQNNPIWMLSVCARFGQISLKFESLKNMSHILTLCVPIAFSFVIFARLQ